MVNELSFKAIIIGCLSTILLWGALTIIVNLMGNMNAPQQQHLVGSLIYGGRVVIVALGGYIVYRISRRAPFSHGIIVGIFSSIIIILPEIFLLRFLSDNGANIDHSMLRNTAFIGLIWNIAFAFIGAKIAEAQLKGSLRNH